MKENGRPPIKRPDLLLPRKTRIKIKKLFAEGHSTKAIATVLTVSEPAVIRHTRDIARRLKRAEAEAVKGALITIKSTTRSNVALGATLINRHLTEVVNDKERIKAMGVEEVQQYAKLSMSELEKLKVIEGQTQVEQGRITVPGTGTTVSVNVLQQYQDADIIPHTPGKLLTPPASPLPTPTLPAPAELVVEGEDASDK